jgi:hypothetical protein
MCSQGMGKQFNRSHRKLNVTRGTDVGRSWFEGGNAPEAIIAKQGTVRDARILECGSSRYRLPPSVPRTEAAWAGRK